MEKVRDRDVQHLQSEIRQLRNQQYLTSTAGVTITFVILALLIDPRFSGDDAARFGISIAFIVTITMLFVIGWRQRKLIAIISSYIRVIGGSYWEDDFRKFTTQYR